MSVGCVCVLGGQRRKGKREMETKREREREREWFEGPHEIFAHLVCAAYRHFNRFHELLTNLRSVRIVTPESSVCARDLTASRSPLTFTLLTSTVLHGT